MGLPAGIKVDEFLSGMYAEFTLSSRSRPIRRQIIKQVTR